MIVWNVKVAILKGSILSKTQERALHSTARLLTQEQMSARRAQTDRAGGREMSHWARGRLIQVSWFADILQTKVSLQRIRESLLTMRGGGGCGRASCLLCDCSWGHGLLGGQAEVVSFSMRDSRSIGPAHQGQGNGSEDWAAPQPRREHCKVERQGHYTQELKDHRWGTLRDQESLFSTLMMQTMLMRQMWSRWACWSAGAQDNTQRRSMAAQPNQA